jgi:hypothetical protein
VLGYDFCRSYTSGTASTSALTASIVLSQLAVSDAPTRPISKIGSPSPKPYTKITLKPNAWSEGRELDLEALASGDVHRARAELLQAIHHIGLSETDLKALSAESQYKAFERALFLAPNLPLEDVVSLLCCCGEYTDPIRALFYEHGETYGLLQFVLATSSAPARWSRSSNCPKTTK